MHAAMQVGALLGWLIRLIHSTRPLSGVSVCLSPLPVWPVWPGNAVPGRADGTPADEARPPSISHEPGLSVRMSVVRGEVTGDRVVHNPLWSPANCPLSWES